MRAGLFTGLILLVLLTLLLPGPSALVGGDHGPVAPAARGQSFGPTPLVRPDVVTTGDLVVTAANSPYVIQGPVVGLSDYTVEGNVSVAAGATLELNHVVLTVAEFIGDTGTFAQRTSHIYSVTIEGSVALNSSILNTSFNPINPYSKLSVNVSGGGSLSLSNSSLEFPGWLSIYGTGSTLSLTNGSAIEGNPTARHTVENETINNDTKFAPDLTASGGAHVVVIDSQINNTYSDNVSHTGAPGPARAVIDDTERNLTAANAGTWTAFQLQDTNSENLTRDVLYRTIAHAFVTVNATTLVNVSSTNANFVFGGSFGFGPVPYLAPGYGSVTLELPAGAVAAINAVGFPSFLNSLITGGVSITLGTLNKSATVTVLDVEMTFAMDLDYNLTFSGPGTTLTAVDSSIDVNFNLTPGTPVPRADYPPPPWYSNKLFLTDGATGYFADVTIPWALPDAFWNQSAVLPDATSSAVFYRWLAVPIEGAGDAPAPGAMASAFYGLNPSQSNNATASAFNDLATANPILATYAANWDAKNGISAYGESGLDGVASLLLATTYLTGATLPDGDYLGGYHVGIYVPGVPGGQWIDASTSPYPVGMNPAGADHPSVPVVLPSFSTSLGISATGVIVNDVTTTNATVAIGQNLTIQVTINNTGTGPVTSSTADLVYGGPAGKNPKTVLPAGPEGPIPQGGKKVVDLNWTVNESVTGRNGTISAVFYSYVTWNGGQPPVGGFVEATIPVTIAPAFISLTWTPPTTKLQPSSEVASAGAIKYAGNGSALVNVTAISSSSVRYAITAIEVTNGPFKAYLIPPANLPGGTYTASVSAFYNGRTTYVNVTAGIIVAGATGPAASTPWYDTSILGIPLWIFIIVAAAIVAGLLGFFLLARRGAKGKLVECGECGALIPEAATACPECGAEFEAELVRCSRCGSTIPSNAAQCPECSAQLLGPDTADPERQGYQDFIEKFRVEAKKELGDNYGEGAFWDWWKRQSSYVSFNQWKLQQSQGSRTGMAAPPAAAAAAEPSPAPSTPAPSARGAQGGAPASPPRAAPPSSGASLGAAGPATASTGAPASSPAVEPAASAGPTMKACSNCGKEIPPDYLVCPFCGAVTR